MTIVEKIRLMSRRRGYTMKDLAEKTGQTPQNLSNKLKRGNFTIAQIEEIAEVLGCKLEITLTDRESGEKL